MRTFIIHFLIETKTGAEEGGDLAFYRRREAEAEAVVVVDAWELPVYEFMRISFHVSELGCRI